MKIWINNRHGTSGARYVHCSPISNFQPEDFAHRFGDRSNVEVGLLGMSCEPVLRHLHVPFNFGDRYFDDCFEGVRQATRELNADLFNARALGMHSCNLAKSA